jgi:hypothetical protein
MKFGIGGTTLLHFFCQQGDAIFEFKEFLKKYIHFAKGKFELKIYCLVRFFLLLDYFSKCLFQNKM